MKKQKPAYELFREFGDQCSFPRLDLIRYNLDTLISTEGLQWRLDSLTAFESGAVNAKPEVQLDTKLRIADCYFITTDYPKAISYYDKIIAAGKTDLIMHYIRRDSVWPYQ